MSCDNLIKKLKDYNKTLKDWHNRINAEDMMLKAVVGNFNEDLTEILNDNEPTPAKNTSDKATDLIPVVSKQSELLFENMIDYLLIDLGIDFDKVNKFENKFKQ